MQVWALIVDSLRESLDRRIFWVMAGISLLVAAAMATVGVDETGISFFFGTWEPTWQEMSRWTAGESAPDLPAAELAAIRHTVTVKAVVLLADLIVGWVGVILAIIATAGFFPTFLEGGAIDVVLSKPISRSKLFLAKYSGSLIFVLLQASWFVGLTFLVAGLRWGTWLPGYLVTIPLMVLLFSYIYSISALVGVKTQSTVAAILISIGAWVVFFGVQVFADLPQVYPGLKENRTVIAVGSVARWVVPKTGDITYLAKRYTGGRDARAITPPTGKTPEDQETIARAAELESQRVRTLSAFGTIGSSLAFEAIVVLWAMYSFSRKQF